MSATSAPTTTTRAIQQTAREQAADFLSNASAANSPKDAADWSLAARNAIDVALRCEQIIKTGLSR